MAGGGLILVLQRLQQIAKAGSLAASSLRDMAEERKTYNEEMRETARIDNASSVTRAAGSPAGTVGAEANADSASPSVTVAGTIAALQITRGRLK